MAHLLFYVLDAYKYKVKAPHFGIHSLIILSQSWRSRREISALISEFRPSWKFAYFGIFALLGFYIGIRVLSGFFLVLGFDKRSIESLVILCEGFSLYLLNIYREVCWVFFPKRVSQGKLVFGVLVTLILLCYWIFVECLKKFLAIKHN
jgi:hypothetical protein